MDHLLSAHRRGFATALAVLALSVPVVSSAAQTSPAVVKALEEAETLMEQGDYQAAIGGRAGHPDPGGW